MGTKIQFIFIMSGKLMQAAANEQIARTCSTAGVRRSVDLSSTALLNHHTSNNGRVHGILSIDAGVKNLICQLLANSLLAQLCHFLKLAGLLLNNNHKRTNREEDRCLRQNR